MAATSNLPNKYFLAIGILIIVAPLYIPIGDIRLYQALGYAFKFGIAQKTFSKAKKGNAHISVVVPYSKISDDLIFQKDNVVTGVIEVKPIEFNMLSEHKQNYLIDVVSKDRKSVV